MTIIEYKIILIDTKAESVYKSMDKVEEKLNELGKDGWDCFYVNGNLFYLKRQKISEGNFLS